MRYYSQRTNDIREAVERYIAAGKDVPQEWVDEYQELTDRYYQMQTDRRGDSE